MTKGEKDKDIWIPDHVRDDMGGWIRARGKRRMWGEKGDRHGKSGFEKIL
jgi:hypothetical protein